MESAYVCSNINLPNTYSVVDCPYIVVCSYTHTRLDQPVRSSISQSVLRHAAVGSNLPEAKTGGPCIIVAHVQEPVWVKTYGARITCTRNRECIYCARRCAR